MSHVRLCDARPDHVQRLISAALQSGYSTQTAKHIRNVVSAIFSHAIRERCFVGTNPASSATLPGMTRKEAHALTLEQTIRVLGAMQYPERELTLIAILTSMNIAEICGLQWKHLNLTDRAADRDGELIPPRTIAVRKQWYRGELCSVTRGRSKNISIPQLLLPVLLRLSHRARCTGGDDFVLMSKASTPINQINVAARRLKTIGRELEMPWLSWQVFRRTHATLVYEFGMQFQHHMAMVVNSDSSAKT
jgi:integrase